MVILENDFIKATISSKGAEIHSLINKANGTEYMWQGNPDVWAFHAPNLFPVVGGLKNNTLNAKGQAYTLNRHGFARNVTFRRIESAPLQAIFEYRYDEETLKVYPYKFEFQVIYHLERGRLRVSYKVINMDEGDIYFSVGAHPAFNVPLTAGESFEDYYLEFEKEEALHTHWSNSEGLLSGETSEVVLAQNLLPLKRDLFAHDALIFKNIQSRAVTLRSTKSDKHVRVSFPYFAFLGIWTKADAPFICIEPWLGVTDTAEGHADISEKEGIQTLEKGHVFETDYCIEVG
ncbi:aldose epimerase [Pelobium manganitolerans]|uniref:Aldose epimerase n=1 Tax=Pelobium manganitolerans TaxID=1842495 RepID=A0A419S3H5_9SPHI|nr:aldose 1-epimerase family protein [Pelobium manganitolerans]RKD13841.1 aldose epimerase [Pelobium manganitolerans]